MQKIAPVLAFAGTITTLLGSPFANSVVEYNHGTGFATEFGTGLGYTNTAAALGEPSRFTSGEFGGPVEPFSPPFLREQLVSIGTGGSLTVELGTPVTDNPANPYGIDFLVFGNAGFIVDFSNGTTQGDTFSHNNGETRVSVSNDGLNFFPLDSSLAPVLDGLYPTDGAGDFQLPVNPSFTGTSFAGRNLDGVRGLYAGSGGGTGFDLDWTRNAQGQPVHLDNVRFVRIEVLSGVAEIDGFAVVPEPSALALICVGLITLVRRQK